ncbi:Protein SABRE [Rhodosporidiobolus nylandii]
MSFIAPILHSLPTLLLYAILLLLSLALLLPLLLRLFILPRGLSIGRLSFNAVHNFRWQQPGVREGEGISVEVKKIRVARWSAPSTSGQARAQNGIGKRGAWVLLKLEDVKVRVPQAALLAPPRPKPTPPPRRESSLSPPSPSPASPASSRRSSASSDAPLPAAAAVGPQKPPLLHSLLRRFSGLLALFAVHVSFSIEVEDIAVVEGAVSAGGEVQRPSGAMADSETAVGEGDALAQAWVRLERLEVRELPRGLERKLSASSPSGSSAPAQQTPHLPALSLPSGVLLSLTAPLAHSPSSTAGWAVKPSSVGVSVEFGGKEPQDVKTQAARKAAKGVKESLKERVRREKERLKKVKKDAKEREESRDGEGAHIRVHELKSIMRAVDEVKAEKARHAPPPCSGDGGGEPLHRRRASSVSAPSPPKPSPLELLSSLTLSLPSLVLSAHYTTPLHVAASSSASPNRPLPQTMAFALAVRGVKAEVRLGGTSDGEGVRKEHREWIGRGRKLKVSGCMEWQEVEGKVKVNGNEDDILHDAAKTLSIGPSRIDLTSTWVPPSLSRPSASQPIFIPNPLPVNHNDATVVLEAFIGEKGATLASADSSPSPSSPSSACPASPTSPAPPRHPSSSKKLLHALPRVIGTLASAGVELRVQAPRPPSAAGEGSPSASPAMGGDPEDPFFRGWTSPELLCVSFPRGQVSFGGEYADRSVKRNEADRRAVRREKRQHRRGESRTSERSAAEAGSDDEAQSRSRRRREEELEDKGEPVSERPTRAFEEEFGVPPPPPLTADYGKRRLVPQKIPANLTKDLDTFGLEYSTRFTVVTDTLNVYILAANHGDHFDEPTYTDSDDEGWAASGRYGGGSTPTLPSDPVRLDILAAGPLELSSKLKILGDEKPDSSGRLVSFVDLGTCSGEHAFLLETIGIDLWRPVVRGCIRDFLSSFASASSTATARSRAASEVSPSPNPPPPFSSSMPPPPIAPLVDILPPNQDLYVALASFDLRVAGTDPKADDHACRGIAAHSGVLVLEYLLQETFEPGFGGGNFTERSALELREDIRVEANAGCNPYGRGQNSRPPKTALVKLSLNEFSIDPVVDARASGGRRRGMSRRGDGQGEAEAQKETWELRGRADMADMPTRRKSIIPPRYSPDTAGRGKEKAAASSLVVVPHLSLRAKVQRATAAPKDDEGAPIDEIFLSAETETITLRLELFSIYLFLVAVSSVRSLKPKIQVATVDKSPASSTRPKRPPPLVRVAADITDLHVFPTLPHDTHLFINFRRIRLQQSKELGVSFDFDSALLAGQSPTVPGKWEDIIRLHSSSLTVRDEPGNDGQQPFVVSLRAETARFRVPFRYIFSRIIDNTANLVKATKQLVFEHIKGGTTFIIEPKPEAAKRLPKIQLDVGLLAVSMQDDPFETKLNIIWRAGYEEQSARLDREAAFEAKVEAIRRREANGGEEEEEEEEEDEASGLPSSAQRKAPKVDGRHSISVEEARRDLLAYNSSHWIKRIRNAAAEQARREEALTRRIYGSKAQNLRPDSRLPIDLLPASKSVPLARATFHKLRFGLSKPSFGDDGLADFLHDVGKGLPHDTQFTLLVPLHVSWKMDEARFRLRDYPLPLLHVPPSNDAHRPSWECEADLVIAEEVGGKESIRRVPCAIIPQHVFQGQGAPYSMVVPRSAMPVKTYMTPTIKIRTEEPTRIGWGNSVQPAIQDLARVIDTLSKPTPDPSDRLGFWDKIRLQIHWRVKFQFEGPRAGVIFHLKGSRDPYALTGFGAGFAKAWKGNVQFRIGFDNPDREFFQILADEYILGIPNLRDYVDAAATGALPYFNGTHERDDRSAGGSTFDGDEDDAGTASSDDETNEESNYWIKVCAKCINGVRWGMGLVCERTCRDECTKPGCKQASTFHRQCRFFDFIPHWQVHTKTAASIGPHGEVDDSFAGFRSDFVHFSISLTSPTTLDLPGQGDTSSDASVDYAGENGYNSFHFTPHANTHFARWWKLFDGTLSLPIRQGKLFPSAQAPSKKFGKHCATIKYRFSLAPLFISHTYRQENWAEWARGETTVLGLKGKIGRFNVDLHQREQEMSIRRPEMSESKLVKHKAFYMAEIDLDTVDLRTITACFKEPEKAYVAPLDAQAEEETAPRPKAESFGVANEDADWINMNDFNDAVYTMPDRQPQLGLLPLMTCPRFTYYRHTDAAPVNEADNDTASDFAGLSARETGKTKFGTELTHTCLMGHATDAVSVQIKEAQLRLLELEAAETHDAARKKELELRMLGVHKIMEQLERMRDKAQEAGRADRDETTQPHSRSPHTPSTPSSYPHVSEDSADASDLPHLTNALNEEWGNWENRYMIHSPTIRVSNATREVLLKYYYSSQDRKGYLYHVSASVIRFIRDLAKEHDRKHRRNWSRRKSMRTGGSFVNKKNATWETSEETNRLLDDLVNRGGSWAANEAQDSDNRHHFGDHLDVDPDNALGALPADYEATTGHLCMFIKPQISLQSDIDEKSTLIITAFRAQLKVFAIVDTRLLDDPVNAEVLHETFARLDGLQVFYPLQQGVSGDARVHAFVPLETLVDLRVETWGFDRVVPRTSAAFRYDKFNQLRLSSKRGPDDGGLGPSSNLESHFHTSTDRMSIECDKFSLSANPAHFAAIYNVVTDLILYSDPARKSRSLKVESLVFTRDFSDLRSVIETVAGLQQRIRGLVALMQEYHVHLDELDDDGRIELALTRAEHLRLASELGLVVEALTRAQDANGPKTTSKRPGVQLEARAQEITWFLLDKVDIPFAKFSVIGAEFSWISKQDGSASNRLVVRDLRALNSSPEQIFAEIIAKHQGAGQDNQLAKVDVFAAALWNSLAPVGGISIVERFELHLHPVRLQLEHRIGRQILDYLFSERHKSDENREETPEPRSAKPSSPLVKPSNPPASRSVDSLVLPRGGPASQSQLALGRSTNTIASSGASVHSIEHEHRLRKAVSAEVLKPVNREEGLDADEMRRRAASNRTFIFVEISSTVLCLSYRSEKEDKSSLPNIYNITYNTPGIQYRSKTWSFLELLNEIKRDTLKSVWQQKGQLIGQLLSKTHRTLPLADARSAAKKRAVSAVRNRLLKHKGSSSSREDPLTVAPPPGLASQALIRRNSSSSSSNSEGEDEGAIYDIDDGHLPFDVGAAQLINPDVDFEDRPMYIRELSKKAHEPFSEEPDEMSMMSSGTRGRPELERARSSQKSTESVQTRSTGSSSSIPRPQRQWSAGYPHHEPLRRGTAEMKDEEKRKMLLGKSAD